MKPVAYVYSCRNPGQVSLLWAHQPPPFGHGWIDVKREPLMRLSDVEAEYVSLLPGVYYMDPPDGGDVTLPEQMRRMAQDAARYRWLLNTCTEADIKAGLGWLGESDGIDKHIARGTTE